MIRSSRFALVVTSVAVVLAGCVSSEPKVAEEDQVPAAQAEALAATAEGTPAEGGAGGETGEELTFVAVDIAFEDAPETAPAGALTFVLQNEGAIIHNVVVEALGDTAIAEAEGGETDSGTVTLEPGTYTYYCSIPGHRGAGMEGSLEVE